VSRRPPRTETDRVTDTLQQQGTSVSITLRFQMR